MTNFFRAKRDAIGITQQALADALGVVPMSISNWENGLATPQPRHWNRLAEKLKVTVADIANAISQTHARREKNKTKNPRVRKGASTEPLPTTS